MTTATTKKTRVLEVSASGRRTDSVSRMLSRDLIAALESRHGTIAITRRDLADGICLVDEEWIGANFTDEQERTAAQRHRLVDSDALVTELKDADVIVIGTPIYNFGIPASLKAWVDMIARVRLTFRYTENGSEGLLQGKKAYVVIASGGVPVDSAVDFATPYLRQALRFVGITDIEIVAADKLNQDEADAIDTARAHIADLIHTAETTDSRAA